MINKMISFIGGGNMATAIIGGLLSSGLSDRDHIYATAAHEATVLRRKKNFGIDAGTDNKNCCAKSRYSVSCRKTKHVS